MKQAFPLAASGYKKTILFFAPGKSSISKLFACLVITAVLNTGCQKESSSLKPDEMPVQIAGSSMANERNVVTEYSGLSATTSWELQQARAATARYRKMSNAIKDGYEDISVVVPNMGYHFMKTDLVNNSFDYRKPEILVYNKSDDGSFELVAVEYAVPITMSPTQAPEGFTGSADIWDRNTGFGLWLLHAWVWSYNPDGVFHSTNTLVHLH